MNNTFSLRRPASLHMFAYLYLCMLIIVSQQTAGWAQSADFRIPLWLSDSAGYIGFRTDTFYFGLHPNATSCVDEQLGEFFMFTECGLFSRHCAQFTAPYTVSCSEDRFPVFLDLRKSWSTTQSDTFEIGFVATPPVVLHWPSNIGDYFDSCWVYDWVTFYGIPIPNSEPVKVDMKTVDSAVIPTLPVSSGSFIIRTWGPSMPTSTVNENTMQPERMELFSNYPNPFNPVTQIKYALSHRSHVKLTVFNVLGQPVGTLVDNQQGPGIHHTTFDARGLSSGMYFYRLQARSFTETRKMVLIR